jgi:hypothetical protein
MLLRGIWNQTIMGAMYLSLAFAATPIPFTLGTEWLNAKRVAKDKKCEVQVDA